MNKAQRAILIVVLAVDLLMLAYPPYVRGSRSVDAGYHWPSLFGLINGDDGFFEGARINFVALAAQVLVASTIGIVAAMLLKGVSDDRFHALLSRVPLTGRKRGDDRSVSEEYQVRQLWFWPIYLLVPMVTGLLAYDWLPNESYSPKRHELITSHTVESGQQSGEMADVWKDRLTGEIYEREDFSDHRKSEAIRMSLYWFSYGLIGCLFFARARYRVKNEPFFEAFGKAVCVDIAIAGVTFASIRW